MTDAPPPPGGTGPQDPHEAVGSLGEEAAKLFGALADWTRQHGADLGSGAQQGLGGLAAHAAAAAHDVDEHLATGSAECLYCPLCRTVHAVRQAATPEVRAHLATAATSFLQAALGVLAAVQAEGGAQAPPPGGVERIDLEPDEPDEPDQPDEPDAGAP